MSDNCERGGISRRAFLGTAGGAALFAVGGCGTLETRSAGTLPAWRPGELDIHFIHTGVGEQTFFIFPDGTTMLLDCGDFEAGARGDLALPLLPDAWLHAGEWEAR